MQTGSVVGAGDAGAKLVRFGQILLDLGEILEKSRRNLVKVIWAKSMSCIPKNIPQLYKQACEVT